MKQGNNLRLAPDIGEPPKETGEMSSAARGEELFQAEFQAWFSPYGLPDESLARILEDACAAEDRLGSITNTNLIYATERDMRAFLLSADSAATRDRLLDALVVFGDFLVGKGYMRHNPARLVRERKEAAR